MELLNVPSLYEYSMDFHTHARPGELLALRNHWLFLGYFQTMDFGSEC